MINRVIRAAKLDVNFYNEVEGDTSLNQEALIIVVLVSIAGGIGALVSGLLGGEIGAALLSLIVTIIIGVVNYYIWAYVTFFVGTKFFGGQADPGELLRVLGYASGPRVLAVLGFVPCVGGVLNLVGALWSLAAGFIGVREALDLDSGRTLVTVIVGWVIIFVISLILGAFGLMGVGLAAPFLGQ